MYRELCARFISDVIKQTGAKVDPITASLLNLAFDKTSELKARMIYEVARDIVFEAEAKIQTQPKMELKL